jgi:hypothetical protein
MSLSRSGLRLLLVSVSGFGVRVDEDVGIGIGVGAYSRGWVRVPVILNMQIRVMNAQWLEIIPWVSIHRNASIW